jgi:DNA-binding NarL/FixJ family response regulator
MMATLRVLVADDHEIVRKGVCALITSHPGWEVCGEACDGREAVRKVAQLKPDIVILDIGMPSLNGLEATRQILHHNPKQRILILSITESQQTIQEVLAAGARAYVSKSDAAKDLIIAVEELQHDRPYFNSQVGQMVLDGFLNARQQPPASKPAAPNLTSREREIVQLLAEGKSTKEIAITLGLSVKTAETHRSNLMRKLGLHSVGEVVLYAVRNNIVQVAPDAPGLSNPPRNSAA